VTLSRASLPGLLLVLLLATLVACTAASPAASDGVAEATPTEEPTPEPTPEPTQAPPSDGGGENELAAILPDQIGGLTLEYTYATGAEVMGSEGVTPEAQAFFQRTGTDPNDLSSAFGTAFNTDSGEFVVIVAFRVAGANEAQLLQEFKTVMEESSGTPLTETSVGGKSVLVMSETDSTSYLYVRGDTIFTVSASPPALSEEALAQLP
jgi:hypothetical protein